MDAEKHGNEGFNVKNLGHTTGCPHYGDVAASDDTEKKCATNLCPKTGSNACHVISANQNNETGKRFIVYMCDSHNKIYDSVIHIRKNALYHDLSGVNCTSSSCSKTHKKCACGHWPLSPCPNGGNQKPCKN